ncbi:MAG: 6,7-dimethyl-8-ribityllumazine synthase [Panacagrimonas sp.]
MSDVKSGFAAPALPTDEEFAATRVAILATRWNVDVVDALIAGAHRALRLWGVEDAHVSEFRAPGAFELPLAANALLHGGRFDAVIALGAVIRGDTPHFEYVAGQCARGLMDVQLRHNKPVAFGVLTVNTPQQASERCGPGDDNKGFEAACAALEMIRMTWGAT